MNDDDDRDDDRALLLEAARGAQAELAEALADLNGYEDRGVELSMADAMKASAMARDRLRAAAARVEAACAAFLASRPNDE